MPQRLNQVKWGGPALSLLNHCQKLDSGKPAVMYIRHTEKQGTMADAASKVGLEAAYEFGQALPKAKKISIYHTDTERTKETARSIQQGILQNSGSSEIVGEIPVNSVIDMQNAIAEIMKNTKTDADIVGVDFLHRWIAGLIQPTVMRPSNEFAQMVASYMSKQLKASTNDVLHLYLSHDIWVSALMFHWFGIPPHSDGVKYLDGFLIQLSQDDMKLWYRDVSVGCDYPYWWR